jgi:O-succinylbenzoate synthase
MAVIASQLGGIDTPALISLKKNPYVLTPKLSRSVVGTALGVRQGCLLRFEWESGQFGYADCFPWPQLGDLPLEQQLQCLKRDVFTPLTRRSFAMAQVDAQARSLGKSLWDENFREKSLKSNALLTSASQLCPEILFQFSTQGFTHIKLKIGRDLEKEIAIIHSCFDLFMQLNLKLRLDLNQSCMTSQLDELMTRLSAMMDCIEYIEDISTYDPLIWKKVQDQWSVKLALDFIPMQQSIEPGTFSYLIIKPAIQDPQEMMALACQMNVPVVITSYLDHPVGQLGAAWVAAQLEQADPQRVLTCGLLSHLVYEETAFSRCILTRGPELFGALGTGVGMDEELAQLNWVDL